jgi:hypothetical protein
MTTTLDTIGPYVEQLLDDDEVRKHLSRASANLRGARARAGRAKNKKKAVSDGQVWSRLLATASAALDAAVAVRAAPEKRKSHRGRWALLLGVAGVAAVAANAPARERVLALLRSDDKGSQP